MPKLITRKRTQKESTSPLFVFPHQGPTAPLERHQTRAEARASGYHDVDGRAVPCAATLARIRALAILPAWANVLICPVLAFRRSPSRIRTRVEPGLRRRGPSRQGARGGGEAAQPNAPARRTPSTCGRTSRSAPARCSTATSRSPAARSIGSARRERLRPPGRGRGVYREGFLHLGRGREGRNEAGRATETRNQNRGRARGAQRGARGGDRVGNTTAVCRKSYVHLRILEALTGNEFPSARARGHLSADEARVIRLLGGECPQSRTRQLGQSLMHALLSYRPCYPVTLIEAGGENGSQRVRRCRAWSFGGAPAHGPGDGDRHGRG
ncbi:unnamed protein product [Gemmata massiliana]|uniref:DNA topoisomerase IB N-terminal domain-containing protein n=1 Tax=Gemmata massiliana TaxID=1210884 RepID=A0A6P2D0Y6_9BACT|nr:unnamed protein product [Gemmata massiliana]